MNESGADALLEARSYSFRYPSYPGLSAEALFDNMDFVLRPSEIALILGSPESGKTTLSRCFCGVYPGMTGAETSGSIMFKGEAISLKAPCDWIDHLGLVFQDPEEQIVGTRCDDEASMASESLGLSAHEIRRKRENAFRSFSLEGMEERDPLSLSGGEKKRLLLAALEMQNPDVWILDETLDELDAKGQAFLLDCLRRKAADEGKGIVLFASKYKDIYDSLEASLYLLDGGRLISEPDTAALAERELISNGAFANGDSPAYGECGTPALFRMDRIDYTYTGNDDFHLTIDDFFIRQGEVVALKGPNGCGKSTLARILCGLIPLDRGMVLSSVSGEVLSPDELNRRCAYLFQNPDYQLFLPTVEEELQLGLKAEGMKRNERRRLTERAIEKFDLPAPEAPPALLSYGARKRLQAGIYSLLEKDLYILDEADSGLDYGDFRKIVWELGNTGAALLIISHDQGIQDLGAHRIVEMKDGRIVGSAEAVGRP